MKLFGKLFITMMCVILLSYMIFGNILVQTAFQTMLNREIERSIEEMKMFQYAMVASLEGLPKDYQATDIAMSEIARSIQQSLNNSQSTLVIYNEENQIVFQNSSYQSDLIHKIKDIPSAAWQIVRKDGHYYLETLCKTPSSTESYVTEIHREIDHIYQDREQLYERYFLMLIMVTAVSVVVLFLFSIQFTRPIRKLSQATRAFAHGNYKSRVREKGHDEVAVLGQDFNQMAGELEESIVKLEEDARKQEEFVEAFSHELKTPLTSIIGYADMIRSMDMGKEEIVESSDYIFRQGKRLEQLARKMMEISYVDKQEIEMQRIDVIAMIAQLQKMTEQLLLEKRIQLKVQVEEGFIYGDRDLLLSLFSNLIDNARKACQEHGVILLEGMVQSGGYDFKLCDDGCGIPQDEIYKITEPFYMVDKSRARKEGGAGIGMALCQKIVVLHHAQWSIRSQLGEGTTVQIHFADKERGEENHEQDDS